jgi:hypothetical protein
VRCPTVDDETELAMDDDLFTPTVQQRPATHMPPWRPESIFYPAFFGGPLAATTLGVINGRRLGLDARWLGLIVAIGIGAFAARIVVTASMDGHGGVGTVGAVAGAVVWMVVIAWQREPFRAFAMRRSGEPASLVGPGFAAAIGCGLLEAVVLLAVV